MALVETRTKLLHVANGKWTRNLEWTPQRGRTSNHHVSQQNVESRANFTKEPVNEHWVKARKVHRRRAFMSFQLPSNHNPSS